MKTAMDKLAERMRDLQNPTVVGLDPRLDLIPECITSNFFKDQNYLLENAALAILNFNKEIIDAVCDIVPAVKTQIAFYEQFGAEGINAYIKTIEYAKSKGLLVIGDIKRGDISAVADAYSDAHLGKVKIFDHEIEVFKEDFVTVNPYMGMDTIMPFLRNCEKYGKGIFVLIKTSNPSASQLQDITSSYENNPPMHVVFATFLNNLCEKYIGSSGYSSIGAVVGATKKEQAKKLRKIMPHVLFLAPGFGSQGAKATDLVNGSIINNSRGIIGAWKQEPYKDKFKPEQFAKAAKMAALDMKEELRCLKI